MKEKNNSIRLSKLEIIIFYFFIYALLGWLCETFYSLYALGHFTKRGFLFGPICPIYGYGAVILILFLTKYKKSSIKLFVIASIVFSLFEYYTSFILDAMFGANWWDYSNEFFNLNGRISIFFSFVWGIAAILFLNHIHPFVKKHLNRKLSKVPYFIQKTSLIVLTTIFIADTIFSCIYQFI